MRSALQKLPEEQRNVILMRVLDEWSHEDVAAALGKTVEATRALQYRALQALQAAAHRSRGSDPMNQPNRPQDSMDPQLEDLLKSIRSVPRRDPEAVQRGRAKFLADVDTIFEDAPQPLPLLQRLAAWLTGNPTPGEKTRMPTFRHKAAYTSLVALVAILVLLFGGASATAYAAQGALPGDALYSLKTNLEDARVRLSQDAANQARLHLAFAERRLDEIARLIGEGRYNDIGLATTEFEAHTQAAIDALTTVAAGDPAAARSLAEQISSALSRYAQTLSGMLASVPETVRPEMERAIDASQQASGVTQGEVEITGLVESMDAAAWVVAGRLIAITAQTEIKGAFVVGSSVKVHAVLSAGGALTAREIEAAGLTGDDGGNANQNGNENTEWNDNENGNSNGNTNVNENGNENEQ